jgi:hypothetical protein
MEFLWNNLLMPGGAKATQDTKDFLIVDFASGENDQVPMFFIKLFPDFLDAWVKMHHPNVPRENQAIKRLTSYSTDLHGLRLDGLLGLFEENGIQNRARGIHAKLETMTTEAAFRPSDIEFVQSHPEEKTWLDSHVMNQGSVPHRCFQFGVLNNDVVGYLFEYYKNYTDAERSLRTVRSTMQDGAMLVVTQPCSLYRVDNVEVLTRCGFGYLGGLDVDLKTKKVESIDSDFDLESLSRLGHYTFLVFQAASGA